MAIENSLIILKLFISETIELGTMDVSNSLNLSKATTSRILNNLANNGFLSRNPVNKKYSLGKWFISLGLNAARSLNYCLINTVKPHVDKLSKDIDATVSFTALFGSEVTIIYFTDKPGRIRFDLYPGEITPPNAAASAKVVYAFLDEELRMSFLNKDLKRFTPKTITDHEMLKNEYKEIRVRGYAMDNQESEINLVAMGVPVFNAENKVMGAIATVGLSIEEKFGSDSPLVPTLKKTSEQISKSIFNEAKH